MDLGQISFSLVQNAFATRWLAVLATRIAIYYILAEALGFSTFEFFFFPFLFFFAFLFAAVIDLLPDLLGVKNCLKRSHRDGQFLP